MLMDLTFPQNLKFADIIGLSVLAQLEFLVRGFNAQRSIGNQPQEAATMLNTAARWNKTKAFL